LGRALLSRSLAITFTASRANLTAFGYHNVYSGRTLSTCTRRDSIRRRSRFPNSPFWRTSRGFLGQSCPTRN
jgi:hypothetical protein